MHSIVKTLPLMLLLMSTVIFVRGAAVVVTATNVTVATIDTVAAVNIADANTDTVVVVAAVVRRQQ